MAIDPVCGMEVDDRSTKERSVYEGDDLLFLQQGLQGRV